MNISEPNKSLPISSTDITLEKVVANDNLYNIPIYQRLYVWGSDQINTLLEDLFKAFEEEQPKYYLGGVMVTQNNGKLDLIDGQQRFTTLWLISKILGYDLIHFRNSTINKVQKSRISFSVRDFANHYFDSNNTELTLTKEEKEELHPIVSGEKVIERFINKLDEEQKKEFATFIYKKVFLVSTQMPEETDENKVFEAMNNRGVQLQQHEILKSTLLSVLKVNKTEMHQYSLLWDACSVMDDYLEKNIKIVANLKWENLFPTVSDDTELIVQLPNDIHSRLSKNYAEVNPRNLLSIIMEEIKEEDKNQLKKNETNLNDYDSGKVRSIINFPMLLLHTLRIFQFRYKNITDIEKSAEVKGKDLIKIFKNFENYFKTAQDVKNFIDLLWNIRKNFDRHVIKWVGNVENNEEVHIIKKLYQSKTAFQRRSPITNEGFALLQSMLYHSQQIITHYWLTPFLNKMLDVENTDDLYLYLEKLDNTMFCNERRDLRTMSYEMMSKSNTDLNGNSKFVENNLRAALGTSYPSYWFYKMDYILWKTGTNDKWKDFRMTAKNSVEHIFPQTTKEENSKINYLPENYSIASFEKIDPKDDFGNLVLLSPGMNSEYSNKPYKEKRGQFISKNHLDSLKSSVIFSEEEWDYSKVEIHRNKMITLFKDYITVRESVSPIS